MCWIKVWQLNFLRPDGAGLENLGQAPYQLLFVIPGISPRFANSRKQMRQSRKSPRYPRRLPQRKHLRTILVLNLAGFSARAMTDCLATKQFISYAPTYRDYSFTVFQFGNCLTVAKRN